VKIEWQIASEDTGDAKRITIPRHEKTKQLLGIRESLKKFSEIKISIMQHYAEAKMRKQLSTRWCL